MKQIYKTIGDVLRSPWAAHKPRLQETTDRLLRSTKLEDTIYEELRCGDDALDAIEHEASKKLRTFPALSQDVFQSFYSLLPKRNEEDSLSTEARKCNTRILDHIMQSEDYPTLKAVCEGRELPAYEATSEFISQTASSLEDLLHDTEGKPGAINTLAKLEQAEQNAADELSRILSRMQQSKDRNGTLEQAAIDAANTAEQKHRQMTAVSKLIDAASAGSKDTVAQVISQAVSAAAEKAEEVQSILGAWGDDGGSMERNEVNTQLLAIVRQSNALKEISRYLGRFREMLAQCKRNRYAYGRGEKYSLELGNDLSRAISSELAMLGSPQTMPLFLRKYEQHRIKQYRRREPIYKGMGDIICCLDESSSMQGDCAAWSKAIALTLLEIAAEGGRNFALVHFSGRDRVHTHIFRPNEYSVEDKLEAAEMFLGGGTNYELPLTEALHLMQEEGYENADVVFLTDGEYTLSENFARLFAEEQVKHRFTVTGILLDKGTANMEFSLTPFCQNIYRTSELLEDDIVMNILQNRS